MLVKTLHIPEINLHAYKATTGLDLPVLTWHLSKALDSAPYCCKITGFKVPADDTEFRSIADWLSRKSSSLTGYPFKRSSFTKVRVDPIEAGSYRDVTAYSRTHLPLAPHTDSSYMPNPHQFIGFQCLTQAEEGGANTVVTVDQVLANLDTETISLLEESVYPFGRGEHAILSRGEDRGIRYYRGQLDHALEKGAFLAPQYLRALEKLDRVLEELARETVVCLKPGEALIFNNKKALHGREGFAEDSPRLLIRIRQHADYNAIAKSGVDLKEKWSHFLRRFSSSTVLVEEPKSIDEGAISNHPVATEKYASENTPLESYDYLLRAGVDQLADVKSAGYLTMKVGRLKEAFGLFQHARSLAPDDRSLFFPLAAISYYLGDQAESENLLRQASELGSVSHDYSMSGAPRVLRIRGLKDIKFTLIKERNGYTESFQRGHFSLTNLCDLGQFDTISLSIFEGVTNASLPEGPKPELILNTVACGDRMAGTLKVAQEIIEKNREIPVINQPNLVIASSRENNAERLAKIEDVMFPATKSYSWSGEKPASFCDTIEQDDFKYPMILRPLGTHTGSGMQLAKGRDSAIRYFKAADPGDYYAIQYHELADKRGLYSKIRVFFIDGVLYPVARLTHNDWNVHSGDRYAVMDKNPFMQEEEKAFLRDHETFLGKRALKALYAIQNVIQLDFFGIDFNLRPDGSIFVFECNAAMRHNFDHAKAFPYTRATLRAVSHAFETMVRTRVG